MAACTTPPSLGFRPIPIRSLASIWQSRAFPKLITVCAPRGYGKTVLLTQLYAGLQQGGLHGVWVALDEHDVDLPTLFSLLQGAMAQAGLLGECGLVSDALLGDTGAVMDSLLAVLSRSPRPLVLFVDNLGSCRSPALPQLLERLVFTTGGQLHVVLASSREIPLDIVRAKLELGALELGTAELSFDRVCTRRLLHEAGLPELTKEALDDVMVQTEGWPTALRLFQVLMSSTSAANEESPGNVALTLSRFSGDNRDMARLLTSRVLVGIDPTLMQFMVELALVPEFSVDLAVQMTGVEAAPAWISTLVAHNTLIFPLDRSRRWLRFHTLLRDFLLAEGRECLGLERRRAVLGRAARWHAERGEEVLALGIALEAHAVTLAEQLLDRLGHRVAGEQGRMEAYIQWVDGLMAIGGTPSVEALSWYVWAQCNNLRSECARRALEAHDRLMGERVDSIKFGTAQHLQQDFLRIVLNLYQDHLHDTHEGALARLQGHDPHDPLSESVTAGIAGLSEVDLGELAAARAHLTLSEAGMERGSSYWARAWVSILWACLELAEGHPAAAAQRLFDTRSVITEVLGEEALVVSTIDFVHARALVDLGRFAQARELALRGLGRARHHGILLTAEMGMSACAALWNGACDDPLAPGAVEKVSLNYPHRMWRLLAASRIRRFLQLGRLEEAERLAAHCGLEGTLMASDGRSPVPLRGDWLLARLELRMARGVAAEELLKDIDSHLRDVQQQGRVRDRVELLLIGCELRLRLRPDALLVKRAFVMAVAAAAPGKLVQPFLQRRKVLTPWLQQCRTKDLGLVQPAELSLLERLQTEMDVSTHEAGETVSILVSGADALTGRERQMLSQLDQGLSNQQIADRLGLSTHTVKWYLRNVYSKLGVGNRSAALARARALGLLSR